MSGMRGIDTPVRQRRRRVFKEVANLAYNSSNLKDDMEALPYKIVEQFPRCGFDTSSIYVLLAKDFIIRIRVSKGLPGSAGKPRPNVWAWWNARHSWIFTEEIGRISHSLSLLSTLIQFSHRVNRFSVFRQFKIYIAAFHYIILCRCRHTPYNIALIYKTAFRHRNIL